MGVGEIIAIGYFLLTSVCAILICVLGFADKIDIILKGYGEEKGFILVAVFLLSSVIIIINLPAMILKVIKVISTVTVDFYKGE